MYTACATDTTRLAHSRCAGSVGAAAAGVRQRAASAYAAAQPAHESSITRSWAAASSAGMTIVVAIYDYSSS